jgi:GntR family transcriptional repressor for pyruvate dehydrogenase complex
MGVSLYAADMARPDSDHEHGRSLVQRAVDAVNAYMVEHDLRVGDSLPGEGHFAAQLGVSRAVMREAFGALAALRLLDVGNGRRPRVGAIDGSVMAASMSHAISTAQVTVAEVWDVRRTLELQTAALAAVHRSDAQAARIVALAEAMAEDIEDMARVATHDIAFHRTIAEASGNALMTQIVASFAPLMAIAVPAAWRTRTTDEHRAQIIERHRALARAIANRDADAARTEMESHFEASVGARLAIEASAVRRSAA